MTNAAQRTRRPRRRRLLVPEVVQSSAMDCGPACLKALLEGHGIAASYGRLREACHTDVDGSSIDTIEEIAGELGLAASQVMVPVDHLLLPGAALLPAIIVVRQPNGMTHFVVAWSARSGLVQLMDPAIGRRWVTRQAFLDEVHVHEMEVPVEAWSAWSATEDFQVGLRRRLADLGIPADTASSWVAASAARDGWRPLAALDAATRMVESIVRGGGLRRGREAQGAVDGFLERAADEASDPTAVLPSECWTVRPGKSGPASLVLRGAVLVSIAGLRARDGSDTAGAAEAGARALPPDLALALSEAPARPGKALLGILRADGLLAPAVLAGLLALSSVGVLLEALVFRSLFGLASYLALPEQRLAAIAALCGLIALLLGVEIPVASGAFAAGRRLELRMRLALLERIARLDDRYFRSRLVSDMAERAHRLHEVRVLPELGVELLRSVFGIVATTAGIVWLMPSSAPFAIAGAAVAVLVPLFAQPILAEGDLRLRSHAGALLRFHLDALLGLVPLRAHAAGRSVAREHDRLLAEWSRAGLRLQRRVVWVEAVQSIAGFGLAACIVLGPGSFAGDAIGAGSALLLAYWSLSIPVLGQGVLLAARQIPSQRSTMLRFLEMLGAPVDAKRGDAKRGDAERGDAERGGASGPARDGEQGVALSLKNVSVQAGGHPILERIDLEIEAGSHVAIVGPSGAGKTSLVGLLLGWHRPAEGSVRVDGELLDGRGIARLRRETAWVDPGVHLWNRSLMENLCYGLGDSRPEAFAPTIESAGLEPVLERLPDGLQSPLGEGGGLVSGGEGQRVRLARASLRPRPRLAILDEPFRGLAREHRRELLASTRERLRATTVLCVTHDVGETIAFDRVLVVEGGRIVEDGAPAALARRPSRYASMIEAERSVRENLWSDGTWRRIRLEDGRLLAGGAAGTR